MTTQTLVLPYQRTSPVHQPRRDLVLSASDCLFLRVSMIESDHPDAMALDLTGGTGGPACRMFVFADRPHGGCGWDYGAPAVPYGRALGVWTGVIADAPGSFDIDIESNALVNLPHRCGWAIVLDWDGGRHTETLARGALHIAWPALGVTQGELPLLTSGTHIPILL
jgi:hypothetical protein